MSKVLYHKAIGSLNYCAVATHPDIAFSVSLLARYMENPAQTHWEAVKQTFCYLLGTKNWRLVLLHFSPYFTLLYLYPTFSPLRLLNILTSGTHGCTHSTIVTHSHSYL